MKKFISMVMAAAMVVSLVPATAFAKNNGEVTATAKIVDAWEKNKDFNGVVTGSDVPEVQLKIKDVNYQRTTGAAPEATVTLTLDNADFKGIADADVKIVDKNGKTVGAYLEDSGQNDTANKTTQYVYGTAATKKEIVAMVEDIVKNGASYLWVDANAEGKTLEAPANKVTFDYAWLNTNNFLAGNYKSAESVAVVDFAANKAKFNIPTGVDVATEYEYNATTKSFVKASGGTVGPDVVTLKEIAAAAGVSGYEDVLDADAVATAALAAVNGGFVVTTEKVEDVVTATGARGVTAKVNVKDDNEVDVEFTGWLEEGDVITINLPSVMDKVSEGKKATVDVDADDFNLTAEDLVYVSILGKGIKLSTKKVVDVAEEEIVTLTDKGLVIEPAVESFDKGDEISLKLSKGFEFVKASINDGKDFDVKDYIGKVLSNKTTVSYEDEQELIVTVGADGIDKIEIYGIDVEATSAKSGAVATIKASAKGFDSASVEVAKVVDYKVVLSVDEDEDVPVIYSGVNVDNYGITDDSDHLSLEVTAEETFPGAWSMRKGFSFELPKGVYVTNAEVKDADYFYVQTDEVDEDAVAAAFYDAYQEGNHVNFDFKKRVFDDVDNGLRDKKCATMTFQLELVADPTFEGDVVLKLTGDLVDEQEVTIAKFVKPYTVKAEQNDMKIDYRYTDIPTAITITEAEAGLWAKGEARFAFAIDRGDLIQFEDDATFEVSKDSELEIDDFTVEKEGTIGFEVDDESDEAATVTIKDMQLFMQRNIPAGPYDLTISSSLEDAFLAQTLFAPDCDDANCDGACKDKDNDCIVDDVDDYSDVVKAAFVNVITSGRDKDDASFTTKVVVPVGESYIIAGENQVALDVPAYVSAAGYTMLPVRAVAVALGIDTQNVLWNQPTRTVTILYGQRIITMTAGQKVVYVNGSAIPASASVEITNGRTFLPMRDLATALGVTDITWDAATKTATLNGNQK